MWTCVIVAAPDALDQRLVEDVASTWEGGPVTWLAPGEAAEFPLSCRPPNVDAMAHGMGTMDIDLNVIPSAKRKKRILLADMDSTMIQQECLDELADFAGIGDEVKAITARAMNGGMDFEEALDARVALLAGQSETIINTVLDTRITMMPGGATLLATMRANGAHTVLVSGGFTDFTAAVAERLGFHEHHANQLLRDGGHLTGTVAKPVLGRAAKVSTLEEVTARMDLSETDVLAVGDGANDLGMLGRAGLGVALHAKPAVQGACPVRINACDLTALLYLQGYHKTDFAIA